MKKSESHAFTPAACKSPESGWKPYLSKKPLDLNDLRAFTQAMLLPPNYLFTNKLVEEAVSLVA